MWVYWFLFLWPTILVFTGTRSTITNSHFTWLLYSAILTLVIGLRFEVGMDWSSYLTHIEKARAQNWVEALQTKDPAYGLLNWVSVSVGAEIWLVNLVCAFIFVSGLIAFCRKLPNSWLALTVAIPYIAIVMAMNYTRQSAAFGFVLWGLIAILDGRFFRFTILLLLATTFHKSAALLIPLAALASTRNRLWIFFWIIITTFLAFVIFLVESSDRLVDEYINAELASDGGWIRVTMNAIPAFIFLLFRKYLGLHERQIKLNYWLSISSLIFIPAMIISPSSAAIDRVALYFQPIQIVVFSYLPIALRSSGMARIATLLVICAYSLILFVWLNFSNFHDSWLPYKWYPFEMA